MDWIHALLLGFLQGITEYLPVSSSGHLELAKELLGAEAKAGGLKFDIIVHVATVMSTLVILWKEIRWIFDGLLKFRWNAETRYAMNIVVSMIPIGIVGLFFKERIEAIYSGNTLLVVGVCLLVTALLLAATQFYKPKERENISTLHAFIIGIAQTVAVLPGLSRSGSTIATEAGAVLVPDGYSADSRRGTDRLQAHLRSVAGVSHSKRCGGGTALVGDDSGVHGSFRQWMYCLQMDDIYSEKEQSHIFRHLLCCHRHHRTVPCVTQD